MRAGDPRLTILRENAAVALREFKKVSGIEFGLDRESVAWVEGFIERQRSKYADENARGAIVSVLGSYLGEAIIKACPGAHWDTDEAGALGVAFDNGDWCYPFAKVDKQFDSGVAGGDSILGFYDTSVDLVATGALQLVSQGGGRPQ